MEDIILYSTGCPRCNVLKKKFHSKGIKYRVYDDIDIMAKLGILSVPVLSVEDKLLKDKELEIYTQDYINLDEIEYFKSLIK